MARRRRGGMGLTGLMVIGLVLYFTGAGAWLWNRMLQFEESCYAMVADMNIDMANYACAATGSGLRRLDEVFRDWNQGIEEYTAHWKERWQHFREGFGLTTLSGSMIDALMRGSSPVSGFASSSDSLSALMQKGPYSVGSGADVSTRVRAALDHFIIGQHYLRDGGSAADALPWLRQGASQPGYGLYSQLALGDLYRHGGAGVAPNPNSSLYYYQQAQQSLNFLSQSNTPQANQMVNGLPASPVAIQQQITAAIADITKSIGKGKSR